jgi:hypothetical protein
MNAPEAKGLVFSGREPGLIPWTLLGFILLSACVHAFGFFIFQTIYPAATRMAPPPAQVGFLTPGTPEADAILRWIDSEDPARAAVPSKAPVPLLMSLPYIPSYNSVHARPTMSPPADLPLPDPDGVSGLDLVEIAAPHPAPSTPPPPPATTTLSFSTSLTPAAPLPSFSDLHETETGELQPASFLLGVSDLGEVRYVFLQESSGDKSLDGLDAHATAMLQKLRFRPSAAPLTWGFATFYWGSSAYAEPTPAPEASR